MILAELEIYHSRPVAPTRRVALGHMQLPVDPPPGFGGILLGGIVANNVGFIDPDLLPELAKLTVQLENGLRIPQPRLRHRFQKDRIGLQPSRHRLLSTDDVLSFSFDDAHGDPAQQVLGAVYAAGHLAPRHRPAVMGTIRRAVAWEGAVGQDLIIALAGFNSGANWSAHALTHPVEWALGVLGWSEGINGNGQVQIQRRYRELLIEAHPDHGGETDGAAQRIADLGEARRILLG